MVIHSERQLISGHPQVKCSLEIVVKLVYDMAVATGMECDYKTLPKNTVTQHVAGSNILEVIQPMPCIALPPASVFMNYADKSNPHNTHHTQNPPGLNLHLIIATTIFTQQNSLYHVILCHISRKCTSSFPLLYS